MIKREIFEKILNEDFAKNKILYESYVKNIELESYDIFISYSSLDKNGAIYIKKLFEQKGFSVYLDIYDDNMNKTKLCDVAEKLRSLIFKSKFIFYIHSQNSETSRWCPWELGLADGYKRKIAVLEIVDDEENYDQEYLKLYPYIDYVACNGGNKKEFWVNDRTIKNKYVRLDNYLKGKEMIVH